MAEKQDIANAGDQIGVPPPALPLKPEDQFRLVNQRLDKLTGELEKVSKPPTFRTADVINLIVIVIGVMVALISAFGLSERISELSKHASDAEGRLGQQLSASEQRVTQRLDKLSEQFTALDERTSRIEGAQSSAPQKTKNSN
ncbi:MAG: hypothetical protein ACLPTF_01300 [Steroidobacteraceae bacterium]